MTNPIKVTPGQARRLQRNVEGQGKPRVTIHVTDSVSPETLKALGEMMACLMKMSEQELTAFVAETKKRRKVMKNA